MKRRTSRLVAITLALVLCLSIIPVMAWAASYEPGDPGNEDWLQGQLDFERNHGIGEQDPTTAPKEDPPARRPYYERVPKPEEPKEPEKPEEPEKPKDDPGRIVTERFIKLIETGRGFEELWSNRESPVWTLGDIENYLARRAGRIPTAGVGFIAHP